jgi:hypothetical protein
VRSPRSGSAAGSDCDRKSQGTRGAPSENPGGEAGSRAYSSLSSEGRTPKHLRLGDGAARQGSADPKSA